MYFPTGLNWLFDPRLCWLIVGRSQLLRLLGVAPVGKTVRRSLALPRWLCLRNLLTLVEIDAAAGPRTYAIQGFSLNWLPDSTRRRPK